MKDHKLDITIVVVLLVILSIWVATVNSSDNRGSIELTNAELSCKKNPKWENYTGYFHINSETYFLSTKFTSCDEFKKLVQGQKLNGKYSKSNHLVTDFYINYKAYYKSSINIAILSVIFLTLLIWAFIRKPIKWFMKK